MCAHVIDGGRLVCDRQDEHDETAPGGHTYTAAWAADRHDQKEPQDD